MNIFEASWEGNVRRVRELLQSGVSVNTQDYFKDTPLIKAVMHNRLEVARLLCEEFQADLNIRGQLGGTAIWWAARLGHYSMVEMLAGWGADMEIKDDNGSTPVSQAALNEKTSVVQLLIRLGACQPCF